MLGYILSRYSCCRWLTDADVEADEDAGVEVATGGEVMDLSDDGLDIEFAQGAEDL